MAQTFYLHSTGTAPVEPDFLGDWDVTAGAVRRPMSPRERDTAMTGFSVDDADDTDQNILIAQFVSDPLRATSISASTVTSVVRGIETSASNNLVLAVAVYAVTESGAHYGTPKTILTYTEDGTELATGTAQGRSLSTTGSAVTLVDGDRVVIEIGIAGDPDAAASHDSTLYFGCDGAADLTNNDSDTDADNPYLIINGLSGHEFWGSKWYLPSTNDDQAVSPDFTDSQWDETFAERGVLSHIKTSSSMTDFDISDALTGDIDYLVKQFVSPPLQGQVIPNNTTMRVTARCSETSTSNNLRMHVIARVVQGNGTDYMTPKYSWDGTGVPDADGSEVVTTLTSRDHLILHNGDLTITEGDRFVLEIGLGGNSTNDHDGTISLGDDNASDLGSGDNSTTDPHNPIFEIAVGSAYGVSVLSFSENQELMQAVNASATGTASVSQSLVYPRAISTSATGVVSVSSLVEEHSEFTKSINTSAVGDVSLTAAKQFYVTKSIASTGAVTLTKIASQDSVENYKTRRGLIEVHYIYGNLLNPGG